MTPPLCRWRCARHAPVVHVSSTLSFRGCMSRDCCQIAFLTGYATAAQAHFEHCGFAGMLRNGGVVGVLQCGRRHCNARGHQQKSNSQANQV